MDRTRHCTLNQQGPRKEAHVLVNTAGRPELAKCSSLSKYIFPRDFLGVSQAHIPLAKVPCASAELGALHTRDTQLGDSF